MTRKRRYQSNKNRTAPRHFYPEEGFHSPKSEAPTEPRKKKASYGITDRAALGYLAIKFNINLIDLRKKLSAIVEPAAEQGASSVTSDEGVTFIIRGGVAVNVSKKSNPMFNRSAFGATQPYADAGDGSDD